MSGLRRFTATALGTGALLAVGTGPAVGWAEPARAADPWGPIHTIASGKIAQQVTQATGSTGLTVVAFTTRPRNHPALAEFAMRPAGGAWSAAMPIASGHVLRPTVVAWGAGNLSLIWQTQQAGVDNWEFHQRVIASNGTIGPVEDLTNAHYAYPWYQAAVDDAGDVGLSWAAGDNFDRVAVRVHGTWTQYAPVPIHHPLSGGTPFIANPLRLFLSGSGEPALVTWGTQPGTGRAIWLARPARQGWATQRIGPTGGQTLGYDWVPTARFAGDAAGDVAAVWSQEDSTRRWTTTFGEWSPADSLLARRVLSHERCDYLWTTCGDVELTSDGTADLAWSIPAGGDGAVLRFQRHDAAGTFSTPQSVSSRIWSNTYTGVQVAVNAAGDALVSFAGGNHQTIDTLFARCPSSGACLATVPAPGAPSWLDTWVTSVGPAGDGQVTWFGLGGSGLHTRSLDGSG